MAIEAENQLDERRYDRRELTEQIKIYLTPAHLRGLKLFCKMRDEPISCFIRRLIESYLDSKPITPIETAIMERRPGPTTRRIIRQRNAYHLKKAAQVTNHGTSTDD